MPAGDPIPGLPPILGLADEIAVAQMAIAEGRGTAMDLATVLTAQVYHLSVRLDEVEKALFALARVAGEAFGEPNVETTYLTTSEVADRLRVSRATVTNWLQDGRLKGVQLPTGTWRIPESAVDDFIRGAA